MNSISALVMGATGHQGGAVARQLLLRGHRVRAFTRDPESIAAHELKRLGAEVAAGSFDDFSSLQRALRGVNAVFAVTLGMAVSPDMETRQGQAVFDAAKTAGVRQIVYASVAGASNRTGVPHFDSKYELEAYLRGLAVPYTVVAPVYFMENLFGSWILSGVQEGTLAVPLPPSRPLQQIAVADIGAFVVYVLEQGEPFYGQRIELAGDELPLEEVAQMLTDVLGRDIRSLELPLERVRVVSNDLARMYEWFNKTGYHVNIEELRQCYPEIAWHTFGEWLRSQDLSLLNRPFPFAAEAPETGETI